MQKALETKQQESCTQFEITSNLLRNLYKFDLTPVTKLVLLELTTHLNESKNGSVVFPSVGYIAEVLGIGLTAAKKAINDLIKAGLIIKTKRNNVKGNYNKYLLTPKVQNSTSEQSENELFKQTENDRFLHEQKKETKKEQTLRSGENVYKGDDLILYEYAKKRAKYSVDAFIQKIKENGGADKIIQEYKKKVHNPHIAFKQTDLLREKRENEKQERASFETNEKWVEYGKKIGIKK